MIQVSDLLRGFDLGTPYARRGYAELVRGVNEFALGHLRNVGYRYAGDAPGAYLLVGGRELGGRELERRRMYVLAGIDQVNAAAAELFTNIHAAYGSGDYWSTGGILHASGSSDTDEIAIWDLAGHAHVVLTAYFFVDTAAPSPLNVIAAAGRAIAEHAIANKTMLKTPSGPPPTRRVYCMRRRPSDDGEIMCWADVPALATCLDIEAVDTPAGDRPPIIWYDLTSMTMQRDGEDVEHIPEHHYHPDDVVWTPLNPGIDPLDVAYDGVPLRDLLTMDEAARRGDARPTRHPFDYDFVITPVQRSAISAHWSAELRRKVEASAERERASVLVDLQEVE